MQENDPNRISKKAVHAWYQYRPCHTCFNSEEPSKSISEKESLPKPQMGSHLIIDESGSFNGVVRSGMTQSFIFTDHLTSYRSIRSTRGSSCLTLLNEVEKMDITCRTPAKQYPTSCNQHQKCLSRTSALHMVSKQQCCPHPLLLQFGHVRKHGKNDQPSCNTQRTRSLDRIIPSSSLLRLYRTHAK